MFKRNKKDEAKIENVVEQTSNESIVTEELSNQNSKQEKKKKKEKPKKKKRRNSGKKAIVSFIIAIILFLILLVIQTGVLSDYEKTTVIVTKQEIAENKDITKGNVNDYFGIKEVNSLNIPDGCVTSIDSLIGKRTDRHFTKNEMVTINSVKEQNEAIDNISIPADASFKVDSSAQVVGGTLRTGDIISIQALTKDEKGNVIVAGTLNRIYVSRVFNSSGEGLGVSDEGVALTVNVVIEESNMETFNTIISSGTIRVIRLSDEEVSAETMESVDSSSLANTDNKENSNNSNITEKVETTEANIKETETTENESHESDIEETTVIDGSKTE